MRKSGLLNPALTSAVARLGHTDTFVVADCGLPIPHDVPVIDLTLTFGCLLYTSPSPRDS